MALTALIASPAFAQNLTVTKQKDKYGYADASGNMVIKAQYTQAGAFENGRAKVSKGNKWGYIDQNGKTVIPIDFDMIEEFTDGVARVKKGGKYGYMRQDGTFVIKPEYDFIGSFNADGYVWVGKGKTVQAAMKGLYKNDKLIIQPKYASLGFYVPTDSADYTDGQPIYWVNGAPRNNEIRSNLSKLSCPSNNLAWASNGFSMTTIFDLNGNEKSKGAAVELAKGYGAIGMPRDGMILTRVYKKKKNDEYYQYNYINLSNKGKKLFKKEIEYLVDPEDAAHVACTPFENGVAKVTATAKNQTSAYIVDKSGSMCSQTYAKLIPVKGKGYIARSFDNRFGFIDYRGHNVVSPTYKNMKVADEESSVFAAQEPMTSKYGFIDFEGKEILPFKYDNALAFSDNKAYVKEGPFWGIVDRNGAYIVNTQWDDITVEKQGDYAWVKSEQKGNGKWQLLQMSTQKVCSQPLYDEVSRFDEKGRAFVKSNGLFGAVTNQMQPVLPMSFSTYLIARKAMDDMDARGKSTMSEIEAYRFNIYNNDELQKHKLIETIKSNLWDY